MVTGVVVEGERGRERGKYKCEDGEKRQEEGKEGNRNVGKYRRKKKEKQPGERWREEGRRDEGGRRRGKRGNQ